MITSNIPSEQEEDDENFESQPKLAKNINPKKKIVAISLAIGAIFVMAVVATIYQDQLFTSVISPLIFKVKVAPTKVNQGDKVNISWTTNTTNKAKYPFERIYFCIVVNGKNGNCKTMTTSTPNDGKEQVAVAVGAGTYRAVLQALDANKKPVNGINISSNGFKVIAKVVSSSNGGGGNGGSSSGGDNGGGGSSENNGSTTSTPTPEPSAIHMPIVMSGFSICIDSEPYSMLSGFYSDLTSGFGLEYRKTGTTDWGRGGVGIDDDFPSLRHYISISISETSPAPSGKLEPNTVYEARYFSEPDKIFQFDTTKRAAGSGSDCSQQSASSLSNKIASPSGLTASDLSLPFSPGANRILYFKTNQNVFITQAIPEIRVKGREWSGSINSDMVLGEAPSYFLQTKTHSLNMDYYPWTQGTTYEVRIDDATGNAISSVYEFTTNNLN